MIQANLEGEFQETRFQSGIQMQVSKNKVSDFHQVFGIIYAVQKLRIIS